jgi:hypothetical protein
MEQTVEAGTVASIVVNVIDDNGDHVAATIDTATTRLQKGDTLDTTWNNAVPTVDQIATGVYRIKWTGLSPAITVDDNDELVRAKINGSVDGGSAWTEYHMPLKVISGSSGDPWTTALPGSYTGSQAGKILADVLDDTGTTLPAAIGNVDTVVDLIKVDTNAILADTGTTIPAQITALNDPTAAEIADAVWDEPLSDHISAGSTGIYLLDSGIVAIKLESALEDDGASGWQYTTLALENAPSGGGGGTTDWTATERSQIRHRLGVDGATATPSATPDLAREATLNAVGVTVTDTNVRVLTVAADTYAEFTAGSNEDVFKADVSALATSANLESVALVTLNTNTVVNALNDISVADVNAQIVDVLTVDTFAEPSSVPPATSTLVDMIHWNFTVSRNKLEQTSTTTTLRNDADSANIATSTVSDNGSTFTRGEYS